MCPPDYYGIEYEINPWMNRERQTDHAVAVEQWRSLRKIFGELGAEVLEMAPVEGLPDLVFTANAAMIHGPTAFLARFRHEQRSGEEGHDAEWLAASRSSGYLKRCSSRGQATPFSAVIRCLPGTASAAMCIAISTLPNRLAAA